MKREYSTKKGTTNVPEYYKDIKTFLEFLFTDIIKVKLENIKSYNIDFFKNNITNDFKDKLQDLLNTNIVYQNKITKKLGILKEKSLKFENMYKIMEKKYKEIKLNEENTNINFNKNVNLKIEDNPLYIKSSFKFRIGELISRFLFYYTNKILNPQYYKSNNSELKKYKSQLKFYLFKKNNSNSNKRIPIKINDVIEENNGKKYPIIHKKYPQLVYLYNYTMLINDLFEKKFTIDNISKNNVLINNIKNLYSYFDEKLENKNKKVKKVKKIKKIKRQKVFYLAVVKRKMRTKKEKSNNSKNINVVNIVNLKNKFNKEKKDKNYDLKIHTLKILTNIKFHGKIRHIGRNRSDEKSCENLYELYEESLFFYYKNMIL